MIKNNNYQGRNFNKNREPDRISKQQRSKLMSKISSKGTKFEIDFIEQLKCKTSIKFSTHERNIKGTPDIVFYESKVCVFLDSDFWHGWQYPRWKHLLKSDFWREKIEKNRERDKRNVRILRNSGWKVIRIWEHNIKKNNGNEMSRILEAIE